MSKVRVHELAKEFDLENKEVIERLSAAGVEVKTHSSSVYADEARAILSKPAQKAAKPKRAGVMIVRKKPQVKKEEAEAAEPKKKKRNKGKTKNWQENACYNHQSGTWRIY